MFGMRLHADWKNILQLSWSIRLMALSAVLSGIGTGLAIAQPYLGVNPLAIAAFVGIITMLTSILGIWARLIKQQGLT
jgi:putative Mn2+ efflux pump MntP